jgi:hypothetical protein
MEDALDKHKTGHLTRRDAGFKRRRKVVRKALGGLFIDRMEQNEKITAKFMTEKDFQDTVTKHLLEQVYKQI